MTELPNRRRVVGPCPRSDRGAHTHAVMNAHELSRFRGDLVYWCPLCGVVHRARWEELHLSLADASVAADHETAQIGASPA